MNKLKWIFLFLALTSCSLNSGTHEKIIKKKELINVLVDLHLADATLTVEGYHVVRDSTKIERYYEDVLKKHHITASQLKASIDYYSVRTEEFDKMYDQVLDELAKRESEYDQAKEEPAKPPVDE